MKLIAIFDVRNDSQLRRIGGDGAWIDIPHYLGFEADGVTYAYTVRFYAVDNPAGTYFMPPARTKALGWVRVYSDGLADTPEHGD